MKENKQVQKKTDIATLPIVPGTIILSAVMLLAFLILLVILNVNQMIDLPLWAERIIGTAPEDADEGDSFSQAFLDSLKGKSQPVQGDLVYMETDTETLLKLLLNATPTRAFYQSCVVTRADEGGKTVKQQIFRVVSAEQEHTEVLVSGRLAKTVSANAEAITIMEQGKTRTFRRENTVFTPESELGLPSFERMLTMLNEAESGKYTLTLSAAKGATCIRAEFTDTLSGTREIYEVLPDCALIFAAESYLPGEDTPYYLMITDSLFTDITDFDESIFNTPSP